MAHVTIDQVKEWISKNDIDLHWYQDYINKGKAIDAPALEYIAQLLEVAPGLTKETLRQLSATDPRALVGANGGAVDFYDFAKKMLSQYDRTDQNGPKNNTLTFYIDKGGRLPFNGDPDYDSVPGRFAVIRTESPSQEIVGFIRQTMKDYEALTNGTLRFVEVSEDDQATISFYKSKPFDDGKGKGPTLGTSTQAVHGNSRWRNVFYTEENGPAEAKITVIHEMGHTIGLRHPADLATQAFGKGGDGFNWLYDQTDTIMSYNRTGSVELSPGDKNAYRFWWQDFNGVDLASSSRKSLQKNNLFGQVYSELVKTQNPSRDFITGSARGDWFLGDQSDDTWHGGDGDDNYIYKGGFDVANGQDGKDTFFIDPLNENGYLTINDFTAGQDRLVFQSDADYDIFAFGGATFVLGSDTDKVVFLKGEFTEQQLLGHAGAQLGIA